MGGRVEPRVGREVVRSGDDREEGAHGAESTGGGEMGEMGRAGRCDVMLSVGTLQAWDGSGLYVNSRVCFDQKDWDVPGFPPGSPSADLSHSLSYPKQCIQCSPLLSSLVRSPYASNLTNSSHPPSKDGQQPPCGRPMPRHMSRFAASYMLFSVQRCIKPLRVKTPPRPV